jgi:predicted DNA-binding transcriptional regulator AlpA
MSQATGKTAATEPGLEPLAVDSAGLAALLSVSERHVRAMTKSGTLGPRPLKFGASIRWSVAEVRDWLACGSRTGRLPDRRTWEAMKRAQLQQPAV